MEALTRSQCRALTILLKLGGKASASKVEELYGSKDAYRVLKELIELGLVERVDRRYQLTVDGAKMAARCYLMEEDLNREATEIIIEYMRPALRLRRIRYVFKPEVLRSLVGSLLKTLANDDELFQKAEFSYNIGEDYRRAIVSLLRSMLKEISDENKTDIIFRWIKNIPEDAIDHVAKWNVEVILDSLIAYSKGWFTWFKSFRSPEIRETVIFILLVMLFILFIISYIFCLPAPLYPITRLSP